MAPLLNLMLLSNPLTAPAAFTNILNDVFHVEDIVDFHEDLFDDIGDAGQDLIDVGRDFVDSINPFSW